MGDEFNAKFVDELRRLIERVEPMLGAETALKWGATPNSHLHRRAPRELIATPEDRRQLESYVLSLEDATLL